MPEIPFIGGLAGRLIARDSPPCEGGKGGSWQEIPLIGGRAGRLMARDSLYRREDSVLIARDSLYRRGGQGGSRPDIFFI